MKKLQELLFLKALPKIGNSKINTKYFVKIKFAKDYDDLVSKIEAENFTDDELSAADAFARDQIKQLKESGVHAITIFDDDYPEALNDMGGSKPVFLFVKGNKELLRSKGIAVVGTRKPCEWSTHSEPALVRDIIRYSNKTIISGLAQGCDKLAHETALECCDDLNGRTIAVLPSGVDIITPSQHKGLANDILAKYGCLLSEYPLGRKANRFTFVERDSIIAALSDVTFAVECSTKSGTMHTIEAAGKYKRAIAALMPDEQHRKTGDFSGNCHAVEKMRGKAVRDAEDLKRLMEYYSALSDAQK